MDLYIYMVTAAQCYKPATKQGVSTMSILSTLCSYRARAASSNQNICGQFGQFKNTMSILSTSYAPAGHV